MRLVVCLLLAAAAGCGAFAAGAILWSMFDPLGAGKTLVFTIFPSFGAMTLFGTLGLIGWILRCDWAFRRPRLRVRKSAKAATSVKTKPKPATLPAPTPFDEDEAAQLLGTV